MWLPSHSVPPLGKKPKLPSHMGSKNRLVFAFVRSKNPEGTVSTGTARTRSLTPNGNEDQVPLLQSVSSDCFCDGSRYRNPRPFSRRRERLFPQYRVLFRACLASWSCSAENCPHCEKPQNEDEICSLYFSQQVRVLQSASTQCMKSAYARISNS